MKSICSAKMNTLCTAQCYPLSFMRFRSCSCFPTKAHGIGYSFGALSQSSREVHDNHHKAFSPVTSSSASQASTKTSSSSSPAGSEHSTAENGKKYVSQWSKSPSSHEVPGSRSPYRGRLSGRARVDLATQLRYTRSALREAREQLALTQLQLQASRPASVSSQVLEPLLERLSRQDAAAHKAATEARYTAMALEASTDRLELELRRVLSIGLSEDKIDIAAIQAGAREYIRTNIGYRAERVSEEPPVAISLGLSEIVTSTSVS